MMGSVGHKQLPSGSGRLDRALVVLLSCFLLHCGGGSSTSTAPGGTGGASPGGGGGTTSGGTWTTGGGGGMARTGGSGETTGSTSAGGSVTSGVGGSARGGTGGSTKGGTGGDTSGGTGGDTSGSAKGGASSTGGTPGAGGRNSSGGTSTSGTGGAAGAGSGRGGAAGGALGRGGAATGGNSSAGGAGGTPGGTFTVTSPGWEDKAGCGPDAKTSCAALPTAMTRSGAGTSPELTWTFAPEGTKSFVVLLQDLNNGTAHWILWNIPAAVTKLAANVDQTTATPATPAGSQQCGKGTDPATDNGYYGPGAPCNVYELVVYALGIEKLSPTDATDPEKVRTQLNALGASILGKATIRGRTNTGC
jgi:Raf kinase inhibitor-like YbhB/YbcL family protein